MTRIVADPIIVPHPPRPARCCDACAIGRTTRLAYHWQPGLVTPHDLPAAEPWTRRSLTPEV